MIVPLCLRAIHVIEISQFSLHPATADAAQS
eukprot:COSAG02_NODE_32264_length_519_cov_0.797619_1_plen_30_part_01